MRPALSAIQRNPGREIAGGNVRVKGKAWNQGPLLHAPVTQRPCLAYHLRLEEQDEGRWREVLVLRDARPFLVEDETGKVLVQPEKDFDVALAEHALGGSGTMKVEDPARYRNLASVLQAAGISLTVPWLGFERHFRCFEGVVEQGEVVSVLGHAAHEVRPDGERPDRAHPRNGWCCSEPAPSQCASATVRDPAVKGHQATQRPGVQLRYSQ